MRIGLVALSGLRAHDRRLLDLGMTLPAVVERSRVISAMPSLGLLYLASVSPGEHELRYFEVSDETNLPAELLECDLVALSALSAQAHSSYRVARQLRQSGIKVVMGGLHASVLPDEAAEHVDAVVIGEGENVWPHVVRAAERNDWAKRIWNANEFASVEVDQLPVPRYDLLSPHQYRRFPVQTSRGCPWRCDFCASGVMLRQRYRRRAVEHIIRDIRAISKIRPKPFIEFADDNTFVDKTWSRELCRQLVPLGIKWFTETDISVGDDDELLRLLRRAGCSQLLIGLESPEAKSLEGIETQANFKAKRWHTYRESIRRIQQHGITVNGCFVLGLDGQTSEIFQQVLDFAIEVPLFEVQITVLTPFPGTPLYDRLLAEGRLINPRQWDLCTMFDVNFRPKNMTPDQLREGMYWLAEQLYSPDCVRERQQQFFEQLSSARNRSQSTT
jgi:radical SAM superfamily enzyme YgiQ (UPF0313 family)